MPSDDPARTDLPFPYLAFAKQHLAWDAPTNLGMSGTVPPDAAMAARLGIAPPPAYSASADALKAVLGQRYDVPVDQMHLAAGTSHANFAAYLGLARGDRIAVESPGYEALSAIPHATGAHVALFERDASRRFALDVPSLRAAAQGARLIVVSDLHNPTGVRLTEDDFAHLDAVAEENDALVLVDEVYAAFDTVRIHKTAARRSPRYVVTSSLTKVWGLGDLRAGWIFAQPALIARIAAWDDLVNPMLAATCLQDAATALTNDREHLDLIRTRATQRCDQVDAWIHATPGAAWTRPDAGITGFVQLDADPDSRLGDRVATRLAADHGVRVVPGSYFQRPGWIRVSYDVPEVTLHTCLDTIARVYAAEQARP